MGANATSFQPGNTASLTHGGRSPRMIRLNRSAQAEQIRSVTVGFAERLDPVLLPIYDQLVDTLTQLALVTEDIASRGVLTRKGVPRPSAEFSLKLKRQALTEWAALGVGKMPPAVMEATKRSNAASQAQRELAERYGPKDSKEPAA